MAVTAAALQIEILDAGTQAQARRLEPALQPAVVGFEQLLVDDEAEARRRSEANAWFGHIAFASVLARRSPRSRGTFPVFIQSESV